MKKLFTSFVLLLVIPCAVTANAPYPAAVENVLKQTPSNRKELERAIAYFAKQGNLKKLNATYFLISNMDIHYSLDYDWIDQQGKTIPFNELNYPDYNSSQKALAMMQARYPGMRMRASKYRDIDSIKSAYLIENIEQAFKVWSLPWAKDITFEQFCEYILPYRITVEPVQNWRAAYSRQFSWINKSTVVRSTNDAIAVLKNDFNKWFTNTYNIEQQKEPRPRLGSMHLLTRKKGACEDIADLEVFTLRSQGIPASIDEIPLWATSSGRHEVNVAFDNKMNSISFDVSTSSVTGYKLAREPAKVIRRTYSKQKSSLASFENLDNIPDCFLRSSNYIDVTKEYWRTTNLTCNLFNLPNSPAVVYACVLNYLKWQPAWWGIRKNKSVVFSEMCSGAVFLPMYYVNGKMLPAGYPVASVGEGSMSLRPDLINRQTVTIKEKPGYVVFTPRKKYKLFYWDNEWKQVNEQTATSNMNEMVFQRVPGSALLLLLPEDSKHKDRPFYIDREGKNCWL